MKIIKIYRDNESPTYFTVDWMLHDRCTYNCSYCPPANKSGTDSWLNLETLDEFCEELEQHVRTVNPDYKIHCLFTGGEPTVWKDFGELVSRIHARGWPITVNSNGSRSLRWWKEYVNQFSQIILSYHTESVIDDEFLEKLSVCQENAWTVLNIMMNPNPKYFEKALEFSKRVIHEFPYVIVNHHRIQYDFGLQKINVTPYTIEQLEILNKLEDRYPIFKPFKPTAPLNLLVEHKSGEVTRLEPMELIRTDSANFNGWECYSGLEGIFIDARGDIMRGTCRVGGTIGNIQDPKNISWPTDPVVCSRNWCGCVTDIMTSKTK